MTHNAAILDPASARRPESEDTLRLAPIGVPTPRRRWLNLLRPLPLLLLGAYLLKLGEPVPAAARAVPDRSRALAIALEHQGLHASAEEIFWVDPAPGVLTSRFERPRAVLRAHRDKEPSDIYNAKVKLSPEGRLLEITGLYNLTETSAVDERRLLVSDQRAAWVIGGSEKTYSVYLADLRGEPIPEGPRWTALAKLQHRITNLQDTGDSAGVLKRAFLLEPAANQVLLGFSETQLLIEADGRSLRIATDGSGQIEGRRFLKAREYHPTLPGNLVTWAVDRARALPWFGKERMQLLKAVAFQGLDSIQRLVGTVTGADGSEEVQKELGALLASAPPIRYTDPETGWPPPALKPLLTHKPIKGEGQWVSLADDPYVRQNPGAPSPFVFSFIRTDRERPYNQTYVVLWDPRQVELHAVSGTLEPKSATGATGDGLVPRKPEVMGRLLAGLNGGFQATHGEYGMMAEGVVYLPPKPYAATVAKLSDGSTGFGTWPNDENVPSSVVSFRQNMTPLIQDGVVNPYKRTWWGGVPPGWKDESRTVRSAICLTEENFIAYLYGSGIDAEHLRIAAQATRCSYLIHLDMNPGHTGLEFYHAAPKGELPELGHEMDPDWEARGPVVGMDGWEFMGRRMIKYMALMNFPRYIHREARDFFYLTLRHVLPGPALKSAFEKAEGAEGKWVVKDLPQHGWPYAIASTWLRPEKTRPDTKVRVIKLDARALRPGEDKPQTVVVFTKPEEEAGGELWWTQRGFVLGPRPEGVKALRITRGHLESDPQAKRAVAALGVNEGGMAVYAEVATAAMPGEDYALLRKVLIAAGCRERLFLREPLGVAIGGKRDLSGHPVLVPRGAVRLVRGKAPGARRIFEDTPIVAPNVWAPLQAKRVRYFRKPKAEPEAAEKSASVEPTPGSSKPADATESPVIE